MTTKNRSLFSLHRERWGDGCGHDMCQSATNICLVRGSLPCEVLLIGEAPGEAEDVLGRPFVGPAGKMLDHIVEEATRTWAESEPIRVAFTNLVGCIPREGGKKTGEPDDDQVKCCGPRLIDMVAVARPNLIVCVGGCSWGWLAPDYKHRIKVGDEIPKVHITHPAAILRTNIAQRGLMVQRSVVTVRNGIFDYCRPSNTGV